ncbi:UNVERIFIED_CONTAM: hypothetical protein Slati_3696500 [Sesamum latifolium]|uniref:Uncharacterized protein n=1 Tax=Sesamum latifolium TaxID=2727402 RepID=A0AAW2U2Q7_9LAMI
MHWPTSKTIVKLVESLLFSHASIGIVYGKHRVEDVGNDRNIQQRTKQAEDWDIPCNTHSLQVMAGTSLANTSGTPAPTPLRPIDPVAEPPRRITSSDTSSGELSPPLLGTTQQMITAAIQEQTNGNIGFGLNSYALLRGCPEEEGERGLPTLVPLAIEVRGLPSRAGQEVPPQWLARSECRQKDLQDIQY